MQSSQAVGIRKYILYFLFMFLSGLLTAVDYFSNKSLSNYIPNQVNLISSFQLSDRFLQNEFMYLEDFKGEYLVLKDSEDDKLIYIPKSINILDISTDDADIEDVYTNLTKN